MVFSELLHLEQVAKRCKKPEPYISAAWDLQCQGQPAESPEDAASFVSNSSTEDLSPECPTDSVSTQFQVSFASVSRVSVASSFHRLFIVSSLRPSHSQHRCSRHGIAGHLTPGSILSVAGSAVTSTRYARYSLTLTTLRRLRLYCTVSLSSIF